MADVSVTAANVQPDASGGSALTTGTFGATITAGQTVYLDSSDGKWKLADANLSAAAATVKGIAMNGGANGQPGVICVGGTLNPGFTVGVGTVYVQSATAGGIAPVSDLTTGMRTTVLGIGLTSSSLMLNIINSGALVP